MPLTISPASHLDHGLSPEAVAWLLAKFADKEGFFTASVELPPGMGMIDCALHGPAMGDDPVPESECFYRRRGERGNVSRMCKRAPRKTRTVTVIGGPHDGQPCILYTAFGGPLAPREVGDPNLTVADSTKSVVFWNEHALSDG